jgi:hypothetical protein
MPASWRAFRYSQATSQALSQNGTQTGTQAGSQAGTHDASQAATQDSTQSMSEVLSCDVDTNHFTCTGRTPAPVCVTARGTASARALVPWLMDALEELCPFEDRTPERRVFQGVTEASS